MDNYAAHSFSCLQGAGRECEGMGMDDSADKV